MPHCQWLGKRCNNSDPGGTACLECMAAEIKYYRKRVQDLMEYGTRGKVETAVQEIKLRMKSPEELSQTLVEHICEEHRLYQKMFENCRHRSGLCKSCRTCKTCQYMK